MSKGTLIAYEASNYQDASLKRIAQANKIINHYEKQGMSLTLRQLYYRLVAANAIPNDKQSYDRLKTLISKARLAGLVSWSAIEDRGRNLMGHRYYISPSQAVKEVAEDYKLDKWLDQDWRPEVWVEKQALEGVVGSICNSLDVDFFAVKGYNSQSEQWRAGRRFARYIHKGQRPIVFHLGDHDPSGLDMTRDNRERLAMFAGTQIMVQRLALNMNQVEEYRLPPNPAKESDGRIKEYIAEYGTDNSWELDALDPAVIQKLIGDAILKIRDEQKWDEALKREVNDKLLLDEMISMLGGSPEPTEGDDDAED